MKKNVASQKIGAQMISATDGSAFTSSVTVEVTLDAGTQATGTVGSGACTHEGNGYHTYAPSQAETNGDLVAFTFHGTGAVPVTVQIYTSFPQTGDNFARLGAPSGASIAADVAAQSTAVWASGTRTLTAGTNIQLPSNGLANVTAWTVALTGNVTGNLSGSVGSVTGAVGSVTGLTAANLDAAVSTRATPAQILTTALTESYAADGAVPTLAQAIFEALAMLTEKSVSGTTLTTKKRDGSTTARTYTLNSSTAPTSITGS